MLTLSMNLETSNLIAPLALMMLWALFMTAQKTMVNLVSLLLVSIVLPMNYICQEKIFWPSLLVMILLSTGLIVVFAYIVSLHQTFYSGKGESFLSYMLLAIFVIYSMPKFFSSYSLTNSLSMQSSMLVSSTLLSVYLIMILLFLVITFIRLSYSKGGGFRSEY